MSTAFLAIAYLTPVVIGLVTGTLVFGGLRAALGKPQRNHWIRLASSLVSAMLSGIAGMLSACLFTVLLLAADEHANAMKLLLVTFYLSRIQITGSVLVGAIVGAGPWRSSARSTEANTQ